MCLFSVDFGPAVFIEENIVENEQESEMASRSNAIRARLHSETWIWADLVSK